MEKEIEFVSDGFVLSGALEQPSGPAPRGAILLLSGSGPNDRDETIAGVKPFRRLSSALAREGFYVFRWDDRGVGGSEGNYEAGAVAGLLNDVRCAMARVEEETQIPRQTLLGHSQGTLIAARIAATFPNKVAGLGLLAGVGLPGRRSLLMQHRQICKAEGWTDEEIAISLQQKERLFDALAASAANRPTLQLGDEASRALEEQLQSIFLDGAPMSALSADAQQEIETAVKDLMEWEWRFILSTDPADDLARVSAPVFAMTGDADVQVEAAAHLKAIAKACERGPAPGVKTVILENHNHLFQQTTSGALSEYHLLAEPFSQEALSRIISWLSGIYPKK